MDLVDMDLELVTDRVAVMVQDQGLDMEQVLGAISVLANTLLNTNSYLILAKNLLNTLNEIFFASFPGYGAGLKPAKYGT